MASYAEPILFSSSSTCFTKTLCPFRSSSQPSASNRIAMPLRISIVLFDETHKGAYNACVHDGYYLSRFEWSAYDSINAQPNSDVQYGSNKESSEWCSMLLHMNRDIDESHDDISLYWYLFVYITCLSRKIAYSVLDAIYLLMYELILYLISQPFKFCIIAPNFRHKYTKSFLFHVFICMNFIRCSCLDIVAGNSHTCALSQANGVKCFGFNAYGQLGYGDTDNRGDHTNQMGQNLPIVDLGTNFNAKQITAGRKYTCALSDSDTVKCWGINNYGQLGYGDYNSRGNQSNEMGDNLLKVDLGTDFNVVNIVAGGEHTCALSQNNTMKCWGRGSHGQLGYGHKDELPDGNLGDHANEMGEHLLEIDLGTNFKVVQIAAGFYHTCALSQFGKVKCWGRNIYGELGYGDSNNRGDVLLEMGDNLLYVDLGADFLVSQIAAGESHTCVLSYSSTVKCFGRNQYGQLGYGDMLNRGNSTNHMGNNLLPVDLGSDFKATHIAAGISHSCALSQHNTLKCFGRNAKGQLGYGDTDNRGDEANEMGDNLLEVDLGTHFNATQIVAGGKHTCVISQYNAAKCFGYNYYGQLGYGDPIRRGATNDTMGDHLLRIDFGPDFVTRNPTQYPSQHPSVDPSKMPSQSPSDSSTNPTSYSSVDPSSVPSQSPTDIFVTPLTISSQPSAFPTDRPTQQASINPSKAPSSTTLHNTIVRDKDQDELRSWQVAIIIVLILLVLCVIMMCCIIIGYKMAEKRLNKGQGEQVGDQEFITPAQTPQTRALSLSAEPGYNGAKKHKDKEGIQLVSIKRFDSERLYAEFSEVDDTPGNVTQGAAKRITKGATNDKGSAVIQEGEKYNENMVDVKENKVTVEGVGEDINHKPKGFSTQR
eukprot:1062880_1